MFKLVGIEAVLGNIIGLCSGFFEGQPSKAVLQKSLRNFLKEVQPNVPKPDGMGPFLRSEKNEVTPLLAVFKKESVLDDFEEVFDEVILAEQQETIMYMQQALVQMKKVCPLFSELIDIVIHTIFSAPSKHAGGGSTSAAIGCIWMDLRPHWSKQDILEFLLHETTHNLVFIDELSHRHYTNYQEIAKKENFAWSAILAKPRPLDKVFHSIIVSVEVLSFRQEHLGHPEKPCLHPPTDILLKQTKQSIISVLDNTTTEKLLTNRSRSLLKKSMQQIEAIESDQFCAV